MKFLGLGTNLYELHITVEEHPSLTQVVDFDNFCRETLKCKCNLIELARGKYPLQLMLAMKHPLKNDSEATIWGHQVADDIRRNGFNPVRIKVEGSLKKGPAVYWEAHWKFNCPTERDVQAQVDFFDTNRGILVSVNNLHRGIHYLSQRSHQLDHRIAKRLFDETHAKIEKTLLPLGSPL